MSTQISISPVIKLEVNTTPITGGSAGQILFQTTGNTVGESSNFVWDNTNNRLAVGTSTQAYTLAVGGKLRVSAYSYWVDSGANALQVDGTSSFSDNITIASGKSLQFGTSATQIAGTTAGPMTFRAGSGSTQMSLFSTGNLAINTTTDAGFRLDVNGTARVQGDTTLSASFIQGTVSAGGSTTFGMQNISPSALFSGTLIHSQSQYLLLYSNASPSTQYSGWAPATTSGIISLGNLVIGSGATQRIRVFSSTGNVAINTTTDAGFTLDVNGTARVQGLLTGTSGITISGGNSNVYGLTFNSGGIGATGQGIWTDGKSNIQQSQGPRTNGGAAYLFTAYLGANYDSTQLVNNGTTNAMLLQGAYLSSNQPQFNVNLFHVNNTLNFTTGTTTVKGIYYNPTLTSMTGVTAHWAIHTTSGRIRFENLPTSSAGLSTGDIWNDAGTLKIV